MSANGLDILRYYELSWLQPNGLPQVAVAQWRLEQGTSEQLDTYAFKEFLVSLSDQTFASAREVSIKITAFLQDKLPNALLHSEIMLPQDFTDQDLRLQSTALDSLIDHNVRFICHRSGQPFTGCILLDCLGDASEKHKVQEKIRELRKQEATPHNYMQQLLLVPNSVLSLHLARKGGFSRQLLRTDNPDMIIENYVQRAEVE